MGQERLVHLKSSSCGFAGHTCCRHICLSGKYLRNPDYISRAGHMPCEQGLSSHRAFIVEDKIDK